MRSSAAILGLALAALLPAQDAGPHLLEMDGRLVVELRCGPQVDRLRCLLLDGDREVPVPGRPVPVSHGLQFHPRFRFLPGRTYRLRYREQERSRALDFSVPATAVDEAPRLLSVSPPLADGLPENLLRLYLEFSRPMRRGEVYRAASLVRLPEGVRMDAILELAEELWDPGGTRVTLLLDPARVKQGLRPREEDGAILEAGRRYRFAVTADWKSTTGRGLAEPVSMEFQVGARDSLGPQPDRWQVRPPAVGSREPLRIRFAAAVDRALARRMVRVLVPGGSGALPGTVQVPAEGASWEFVPDSPWTAAEHRIAIDPRLEDPCGNSVLRPFETAGSGQELVIEAPVAGERFLTFRPRS